MRVLEQLRRRSPAEERVAFVWHGERRPLRPIAWAVVIAVCLVGGFYLGRLWNSSASVQTVLSKPSTALPKRAASEVAEAGHAPARTETQPPPVTILNKAADDKGALNNKAAGDKSTAAADGKGDRPEKTTDANPAPAQTRMSRAPPARSRSPEPELAEPRRAQAERTAEPRRRVYDYDGLRQYMLKPQ